MLEKNKTSNGFTNNAEEIVAAPIFDVSARQTACRVVPMSLTNFETSYLGATQTNVHTQHNDSQPFQKIPRNINPQHIAVSKPKSKTFLKIFLISFLLIITLCAGTLSGFVLAQYQNQKEKFGIALIPQPALISIKNFPELKLEAFEDPNEIEESDDEITDENLRIDDSTEPEISQRPNDSRKPQPKQEKRNRVEHNNNEEQPASPQEQRDRKVRTKPNQSVANNNRNRNRQSNAQPQTPEDFVFEKIKKIIEMIGQY